MAFIEGFTCPSILWSSGLYRIKTLGLIQMTSNQSRPTKRFAVLPVWKTQLWTPIHPSPQPSLRDQPQWLWGPVWHGPLFHPSSPLDVVCAKPSSVRATMTLWRIKPPDCEHMVLLKSAEAHLHKSLFLNRLLVLRSCCLVLHAGARM